MNLFDTHIMVDWSGGNDAGAKPKKDAIWAAVVRHGTPEQPVYLRNRQTAEDWLAAKIDQELVAQRRVCIGFDFPFGYPQGFAQAVTGSLDPLVLWDWLEARIEDSPQSNNRCEVAGQINAMFDGIGPFWGNPFPNVDFEHLPRKGLTRTNTQFPEKRVVEERAKGSFACWQLSGAGAVGSQVLMGLPVLARLRRRFAGKTSVWPFEPLATAVAFVEIWPSLIAKAVTDGMQDDEIKDAAQVRILAQAIAKLDAEGGLAKILDTAGGADGEGWILGVGHEAALAEAAKPATESAARLPNDCFALPPGVDWTPVDAALASLRAGLKPVAVREPLPVAEALDRVLAVGVAALRSNPPAANSAIDGYGFAFADMSKAMPLVQGRAAAGGPFVGPLRAGYAVRVLTGALLPEGVDTVVMQEECELADGNVHFTAPVKPGQNTRKAGEDVKRGETALEAGTRLRAPDLALLSALGVSQVPVFARLRVGVLSTGDELAEVGPDIPADKTFDANRPMLLGLATGWGHAPVDLGHVKDDRDALRAALEGARQTCDVVLTSGGASAGDEDHVSALLSSEGGLTHWRIAIKPGRPLALAMWDGMPVFGLPGNPVAAFVCSLVFARPALSALAGSGWIAPQGFDVPAGFAKSKKRGRREYLRARMRGDGHVEVFASEGSGRISGLSWADGLVELGDEAREISHGDMVRYIPFGSFGL